MKTYLIKVRDGIRNNDAILRFSRDSMKVELEIEYKGSSLKVEDEYPFYALVKLRTEFEKMGQLILCNGSRLDVYPSGMALTSVKAYELKIGEPAFKLLNIYEFNDDANMFSTVNEQRAYFERWRESLK